MDAGHVILRPLHKLFEYINYHGYFMCDCGCLLKPRLTKFVIQAFNLESDAGRWIYEQGISIDASKLGFSRDSFVYKEFVLQAYELSKNLHYFEDDGSAEMGFGQARHDQTVLSIYALLLHLDILSLKSPTHLKLQDEIYDLCMTWRPDCLSSDTHIYHCRLGWAPDFTGDIVWNK